MSGEVHGFVRRRWVLVIAAPVLAMLLAAGWMLARPTQYEGTGSLVLHVPDQRGPGATLQWVTNFRSALTSRTVAAEVAEELGIPADQVRSGLSAEQIGQSAIVEISYEGTPRAEIEPVMRAAAAAAVSLISGADVATARAALETAEERYAEIVAERRAFLEMTGALNPQEEYRGRIADLVAARRAGNDELVAALEEQVDRLGDLAARVQRLEDGVAQAAGTLNAAERAVIAAEAPAAAAADEALDIRNVRRSPEVPPAIRTGIATLLAAFVIGLALALFLDAQAGRVRLPSLASLRDDDSPDDAAPAPVADRPEEPLPVEVAPEPRHTSPEPERVPQPPQGEQPPAEAVPPVGAPTGAWPWQER